MTVQPSARLSTGSNRKRGTIEVDKQKGKTNWSAKPLKGFNERKNPEMRKLN
jgi:hypothetical protein